MKPHNSLIRRPTIAILGGHITEKSQINFARKLGKSLIRKTELRICTSGYKGTYSEEETFTQSFAFCVADAGSDGLENETVYERFLTRPVKTIEKDSSIFLLGQVLPVEGKNAKSRRLSIISQADVVCLGAGIGPSLKEMYDFAKASNIPVLPLPFFGGRARKLWLDFHEEFTDEFGIEDRMTHRWSSVKLATLSDRKIMKLLDEATKCIVHAITKRCLIFMPFAGHFRWVYDRIIEPAAKKACIDLVRIDLQHYAGNIVEKFHEELSASDHLIAVATGENANVFYEIGFAHALGREVLFLCQRGESSTQIQKPPFYIRNHRIVWYPSQFDEVGISNAIDELCIILQNINK